MIFVTHFTAVANFQFLHNRYIIERKLHWYSEAFEFHQRQRPTTKPNNGKQNAWAFLVPRIFSEGQLSAILNHPAAKTLETRFCDDENLVIDGLKFARAMCSFLFQISVVGQLRFTAIP